MQQEKKLSLMALISMAVGMVIGAGIFNMMPAAIGLVGRGLPIALVLGCLVSLLQLFPQLFISAMVTTKGGMYATYSMAFSPKLSGIFTVIVSVMSISCATTAVGLSTYVIQLIPGLENMGKYVALAFVIFFYLVNIRGSSSSAMLQNILMVVLLVALALYIFLGLPHVDFSNPNNEPLFSSDLMDTISAITLLSSCAGGANMIASFADECRNPRRDIPLAMILSTVVVIGIYGLMAVVTTFVIPVDEVVAAGNLGVVAQSFMSGPVYLFFMVGGAIFALATTLNTHIATTYQAWLKMADDGWLPAVLAKRTKGKLQYPYVLRSIIFMVGAFCPIMLGWDVTQITGFFMMPSAFLSLALYIACLTIPKRYPELWKKSTFKAPMGIYYLLMLAGLGASLVTGVGYLSMNSPLRIVIMLGLCVALAIYCYWRYKKGYVKASIEDFIED